MTASTPVVGYPVHRVATYRRWTNPHKARFTDWTAACGASGFVSGHSPFNSAGSSLRLERCPACFPNHDASGFFPDPVELIDPAS